MKITHFEKEVIKLLLKDHVKVKYQEKLLNSISIIDYDYTGAGYFLELECESHSFEKETIYEPIIIGKVNDLFVGFLLFVMNNRITIECHSWGAETVPENIRDLDLKINIETLDTKKK